MKYRNAVCIFCGCDNFFAVKRPRKLFGRYCAKCGTFNGCIPQKDFKLFKEAGEAKIGNNTVYGVTKL